MVARFFRVCFWAILAVFILMTPAAQAGKSNDTLNVLHDVELSSVDNYFNTDRMGVILSRHIWDSLLYRDIKTYEYKPLLATSYKFIDGKTIEMELRQGVKFHNGEEFDADDVVYTLNWVSDPKNKVKTQRNVNWIEKCEKLGKYKIRVRMKKNFPAALEYLSGPVTIYPKKYYSQVGPEGMALKPVGTGPYKCVEVVPGKGLTLVKNSNYFDGSPKGKPHIGKINIRFIREMNTQIAELMSGRADWIWRVPADQAEKMSKIPKITVLNSDTMRIYYLTFDAADRKGRNTPVKNLKVRQAIAYAIDRPTMLKTLVKGASQIVNSACYPSQFGCTDDVTKYEYNPAKAKKLLAEAGYPHGCSINFYSYRDRPYLEAIQNYLSAVGIKANLNVLTYAAARDKIRAGEVDLAMMTWGSYSINDVSAIIGNFFKGGADDTYGDKQLIDWIEKGDTSVDPAVRKKNYKLALQRIADRVYWLPLWSYSVFYAYTRDLNFIATPDEIPRFFLASWK
jgi:peptide/nickel transport system substrate-binding protein